MEHRLWDQEHLECIGTFGVHHSIWVKKKKKKSENVGIVLNNWVKDKKIKAGFLSYTFLKRRLR